ARLQGFRRQGMGHEKSFFGVRRLDGALCYPSGLKRRQAAALQGRVTIHDSADQTAAKMYIDATVIWTSVCENNERISPTQHRLLRDLFQRRRLHARVQSAGMQRHARHEREDAA